MRFTKFIIESKELQSNKSGKWSGVLFRAIDSKSKASALGSGMYFTPDEESAIGYGKKIKKFQTKSPLNVLGTNSREHDIIKRYVNSDEGWDKYFDEDSIAERIRIEAEERGYDAIFGGSVFGIVVFDSKKIKEF